MAAAALPVMLVGALYVALVHGHSYVPHYAQSLLVLQFVVIAITISVAIVISLISWPSVRLISARRPAVESLRKASAALKAATFLFMIATVGPVWTSYTEAASTAAQQAQWRSLADQVVLRYPGGLGEAGFQALMAEVGQVVKIAEERRGVAMSYAFTPQNVQADFGGYETFAIVNQEWLDLMLDEAPSRAIEPATADQLPSEISEYLTASLPLWTRPEGPVTSPADFEIYKSTGSIDIPLAAGGSGDLIFPDHALILVTPAVFSTFDDDFLSSISSTNNLVFSGLEPTLGLLTEQGLQDSVRVNHVAEDGLLRAQLTAYLAWLRGASLVGLLAAFGIAAGISAFINASIRARKDFVLRLAGKSWRQVLGSLLAREWAIGIALVAVVAAFAQVDTLLVTVLAGLAGAILLTLAHVVASRWCFVNVGARHC